MFSSKSDIYRGEWLELVFANRNKGYGAYELRQSYNHTLVRALLISCSLISCSLLSIKILERTQFDFDKAPDIAPQESLLIREYNGTKLPIEKPERPIDKHTEAKAAAPKNSAPTKRFITMVPVPGSQVVEQPPTIEELRASAVGVENIKGTGDGSDLPGNNEAGNGKGAEQGAGTETGEEDYLTTVEKLPVFPGGVEAFSKFLSKHLQYPAKASDENIAGKVLVSFIVEKDGRLTDFEIVRGIGFGCDEEAIRVLRKAPAWIPGEQNGKKVRVKYTIPIVFHLGEE